MKLENCESFVVGNPPPSLGGRYFIFVKLKTACGIVGYGEIYAASFSPHLTANLAEDMFARYLAGADPHQIEQFVRRAYGSGFTHRPDPTVMGVVSGLKWPVWILSAKPMICPVMICWAGGCMMICAAIPISTLMRARCGRFLC